MAHTLKYVKVSKGELRRMFRDPTAEDRINSGELQSELLWEGHPSPIKSGEPFCTRIQSLSFCD